MNFSISVQEMQEAIVYLKPVLNRGSDELSNLLRIEVKKDEVVFSASNSITSIRVGATPSVVKQLGAVLTPAKQLISHLNTFSIWNGRSGTKDFCFHIKNDRFMISSETHYESGVKSKKSLDYRFLDPAKFRETVKFPNDADFSLNVARLKPVFKDVLSAIMVDNNKEALRGAYLALNNNTLCLVGTDGKRISEYSEPGLFAGAFPDEISFTMDYTFAAILPSVFKQEDTLEFKLEGNRIFARNNNITLIGKLIKKEFPKYTPYFDNFLDELRLSKMEFIDNLTAALPLLNKDDYNRFVIKLLPNKLLFSAENFRNECDLVDAHNFNYEFHVNGIFLDSCLKALQGNDLSMRWYKDENTEYLVFETPDNPTLRTLLLTLKH
jgi:DNA polymerase III sliding clamp (beta) subunit (PCNA family)